MRNIRFKAKNLCGHWVEGDLCHQLTGGMAILGYKEENGMGLFSGCQTIDPSTVCQFTGLRDKNGKEIWEGDILSNYPFLEGEVSFYKGCLIVLRSDGSYVPLYEYINNEELDVANLTNIGSKFDRKEEK